MRARVVFLDILELRRQIGKGLSHLTMKCCDEWTRTEFERLQSVVGDVQLEDVLIHDDDD